MAPPLVKAKATGPLAAVTLLGTTISIILLIVSLVYGDGFSFVATLLLSFLTTLVGIVNKWKLNLAQMPKHSVVRQHKDENNVVIRYPNGSFLVVRCDEDVARELFFAPEEIKYNIKSNAAYRLISLLGTLMLMLGIVCLANARLQLQFAWGGAYIIINAAHWAAAAVPPSYHWDLSCYIMKEEGIEGGPYNQIFTEALWRAILLTKSKKWTGMAPPAAPQSAIWDKWLDKAVEQASAAKSHIGKLDRPLWPGEDTKKGDDPKGDIWETPNHWNAKAAWDELYNEARRTTGNANVLGNGNATGLTARNA